MKVIWAAAVALHLSSPAAAQISPRVQDGGTCSAEATELLILGSYHMDNPGLDAVNPEADDVLTPRRQAEIAALNAALLQFRPTKVAVEGDRQIRLARPLPRVAGLEGYTRPQRDRADRRLTGPTWIC
jgi:hypothetical protein